LRYARPGQQQRHPRGDLVEALLLQEAVVAEVRAVVGAEDDHRVVEVDVVEQLSEQVVDERAAAVVSLPQPPELRFVQPIGAGPRDQRLRDRGRQVRRVGRIDGQVDRVGIDHRVEGRRGDDRGVRRIEADPQQVRAVAVAIAEPGQGIGDVLALGGLLDRAGETSSEDPRSLLAGVPHHAVCVGIDRDLVAEVVYRRVQRPLDLGLEGFVLVVVVVLSKAGGLPTRVDERLRGKGRPGVRHGQVVVEDAGAQRREAGDHRGAGGDADRAGGVGRTVAHAGGGEGIEVRRNGPGRAVAGEAVGALLVGQEPEDVHGGGFDGGGWGACRRRGVRNLL